MSRRGTVAASIMTAADKTKLDAARNVVLTSDQTMGAAALIDCPGMSAEVLTGQVYRFQFFVPFVCQTSLSTGLFISVNGPAAPTMITFFTDIPTASNGRIVVYGSTYDQVPTGGGTSLGASTIIMARMFGTIIPSVDGTLQLRYRSNNTNTVTIKAGATLEIVRVY